jgi:uncharacterized membrane protein
MFMPHPGPSPFGFFFGILGLVSSLAIVAGVVLLVIWAVRAMPRTAIVGSAAANVETPEDILARRFAMGEISAEDFIRVRDLLRGGSGVDQPKPPG